MASNKKRQPKSFEEKKQEISKLTDSLHERVNSYFETPEQMKEYLEFRANFYQYSMRNTALIQSQFRGAEAVGSFGFWKKNGFAVHKGEKGIKILKPNPFQYFYRENGQEKILLSKATAQEKKMIENQKLRVFTDQYFAITHVFDVSQTNATTDDLPELFPNRWLQGKVENYDLVYASLEKVAEKNGITILKEPLEELGAAKGVSYPNLKAVALNPRNDELQNVKTLIHELTHATLHTFEKRDEYTHNEREFQAELTAFTVSSYIGLDTSEYSLRYINTYAQDESQFDDKLRLLDEVKATSAVFLETIESDLVQDRNREKELLTHEQQQEAHTRDKSETVFGQSEDLVTSANQKRFEGWLDRIAREQQPFFSDNELTAYEELAETGYPRLPQFEQQQLKSMPFERAEGLLKAYMDRVNVEHPTVISKIDNRQRQRFELLSSSPDRKANELTMKFNDRQDSGFSFKKLTFNQSSGLVSEFDKTANAPEMVLIRSFPIHELIEEKTVKQTVKIETLER